MDKNALLTVFRDASNSGWSLRSDIQVLYSLQFTLDFFFLRLGLVCEATESDLSVHWSSGFLWFVQLQDWLEAFADHVKQRTESVIKEVEQLGTGAGEVELYLQNTSNSLRALSATQFIENVSSWCFTSMCNRFSCLLIRASSPVAESVWHKSSCIHPFLLLRIRIRIWEKTSLTSRCLTKKKKNMVKRSSIGVL